MRDVVYTANEQLILGIVWIATLDDSTCWRCATLSGQVFPVGEGPRPIIHYSCRCATTPVLLPAEELVPGRRLNVLPEEAQASMNGQVPAGLNYDEWLRTQPVEIQNRVLGRRVGRLYRAGRVEISDFVDASFNRLTIRDGLRRAGIDPTTVGLN